MSCYTICQRKKKLCDHITSIKVTYKRFYKDIKPLIKILPDNQQKIWACCPFNMIAKFLFSNIVSHDNGIKVHIIPKNHKNTTKCSHFVFSYLVGSKKVWRFCHIFVVFSKTFDKNLAWQPAENMSMLPLQYDRKVFIL